MSDAPPGVSSSVSTHNDDSFVPPQRKLREDVDARVYKMNRSVSNLAIIFNVMFYDNARAEEDMQRLKDFLCGSWNFNVVQVKVDSKDLEGDKTKILKHWLARVFSERGIMREDDDYVFVGFFYKSNLELSSEALWDGMVTEDSFMFTRPKILFFQEYEHIVPQTDGVENRSQMHQGAIGYVPPSEVHQPSHLDIISIHGYGYDYVTRFTDVARQDPEMELCDLLTNVHKKFLPNRTEKCPYYISTLQRNLHLTNISLSSDQVDNTSNMNTIQNLIKSEVPEAKERVKWEEDYKSLQLRLKKLSSAVENSTEQNKDKYLLVEKDLKVAQKYVFLRRAHQRHENLENWFQPEYDRIDRIVSELQDIQQNSSP